MTKVKVGVVVAVLNQFELALQALESIRTNYDWQPYIIDNWRDNRGVGRAWNLGIRNAIAGGCTHILVMNDDIIIAPLAIDKIIENWPEDYIILGMTHYNDITADPTDTNYDESPDFGAVMIKPDTIDQIGLFDENIFAWYEDNSWHYRTKLAGKKAGRYHDAAYHHFKSVTTDQLDQEWRNNVFQASHNYYLRKWGGEPEHEIFTHPYNDPNMSIKDWIPNYEM